MTYWLCKLFGHKFMRESVRDSDGTFLEDGVYRRFPSDYCVKCGLNKGELLSCDEK